MKQSKIFIYFVLLSLLFSSCQTNKQKNIETQEVKGSQNAEYYLDKAKEEQKKEDSSAALVYYLLATRIDPNLVEAHYQSGNILFDRNENKEAISYYDKVVQLNSNYKNVRFNRGLSYLSIDKHIEALSDFQFVISKNPQDIESHKNIGIIYLDYLKDYELAQSHFHHYLDLGGKDQDVQQWLLFGFSK